MIKSDFFRCSQLDYQNKRLSQVWGAYDPSTEKIAQKKGGTSIGKR
jgi:hypothetical protein